MSQQTNLMSFLEHLNPTAASNAKKMEELLYQDPSSAIVKVRLFVEEILTGIFIQENITQPYKSTLFDKITLLSSEGYLVPEIQNGLHTVRITGNKAAHNGQYDDLSEALQLHKIMYKIAVWFYETYSTEQIQIPVYEYPRPSMNDYDEIQNLVKKEVLDVINKMMIEAKPQINEPQISTEKKHSDILEMNLLEGESYLLRELNRLQDSSKEAIENSNEFSLFKNYLHINRKIQQDFEQILLENNKSNESSLILLCGSVGDGKSHLLAYLKENKPELINEYRIFNDATESFSPTKSAMETLREVLEDFSDQKIQLSNKKVILAINLGILHNFITTEYEGVSFEKFKKFISNSNLFTQKITTKYSENYYKLISFGDYHSYELTKNGAQSKFFSELLNKIFNENNHNPFFLAYKKDIANYNQSMIHNNFKFMQNEFVQKQIVHLIIKTIVKYKLVVSARAFLNFIADIIIPDSITPIQLVNDFERIEQSVPTLIFNRKERSSILKAIYELDPIHIRSPYSDKIVIDLNTLSDWKDIIDDCIYEPIGKEWISPFIEYSSGLTDHSFIQFADAVIRLTYLTNESFSEKIQDNGFNSYVKMLFDFNYGNNNSIKLFYEDIKKVIFKWKGSPHKDYIYINNSRDQIKLADKLNLKPKIDHLTFIKEDALETFKSTLLLAYGTLDEKPLYLEIDFSLYSLFQKVLYGYCPNKKDEDDAIKFIEFMDKTMQYGEKKNEILIHFQNDFRFYKLLKDDFGSFVFEREN